MRIRTITTGDGHQLWSLVLEYLKETYADGGEFPPTLENATRFALFGIEGAASGDPCIVAEEDGKLVGFVFARGIDLGGMESRHKTIRSWGTYIEPAYRSKGIAVSLFIVAGRLARIAGYTRFLGMTIGTGYEEHALGVVNRIPGMRDVGKVMVMDLTRKSEDAPEVKPEIVDDPSVA
jgi:GNAT superfamily N-acetyltransferase